MNNRLFTIFLTAVLSLAAAQISYPTSSFLKALGAPPNATSFEYKGAKVEIEA